MSAQFEHLADLAAWHEQQADPVAHFFRRRRDLREHRETAALFRLMIGNRFAADPERLTLIYSLPVSAAGRWCKRHGYRCVTSWPTVGVVVQRGDEPPLVARLGDTLLWDGHRITVLERT
ncbi:hypothetical protein ME763_32105 [Streptomyces murinus]|uniref:hypothetical protein n=1 Tax=Streptomyces murinus TaxID=33900 RepID=UPI000A1DFBCD|nr:hypothetical protein [Streptomyces murinus]WDO09934.1 hypothetical protein ME763_32105 [Streptomyces murinus]